MLECDVVNDIFIRAHRIRAQRLDLPIKNEQCKSPASCKELEEKQFSRKFATKKNY